MVRVLVFDRRDTPLFELSPDEVFALVLKEEVNGSHTLEVTTTRILQQGWRILTQSATGRWREHVVYGTDALHESGDRPLGTYYCTWSVQPDLMGTRISSMPGTRTPVTAAVALEAALEGTNRWNVGTVTQTTTGSASFYDTDGWSALSTLLEVWGGEIDVTIQVSDTGITSRSVDLYSAQGNQTPTRRYDFGEDLLSVRRKVEDGPLYCRITPRGRGEETDSGGYGRKITIESVNDGKDWLQNAQMVELAKLPDGSGGWEYPTKEIENADCETPAQLLSWAQSVLEDETAPKVTYTVDVMQLSQEGVDMQGVSLGDAVHVVDRRFGDGVRIAGRVVAQSVNLLQDGDITLTIGHLDGGLAGMFGTLGNRLAQVTSTVQAMNGGTMSTADYLSRLLDRLNADINATGGYTYITEGQGIRTYDTAVSDPLVGSEASAVVEIKGGTIRIANSRTQSSDWDWKTVFTSGHVAADLVTAASITAGFIGSPSGNYWNLDTGEARFVSTTEFIDGQGNPVEVADMVDMAQTASANAEKALKQEVGGTNLLIDTNNQTLAKKAATADRAAPTNGTSVTRTIVSIAAASRPVGGVTYAYRASFSSGNLGKWAALTYYNGQTVKLLNGRTYTVSCWAKASSSIGGQIKFQYGQTSYRASDLANLSTIWQRYSWTFTFSQSATGGSSGARVYFLAFAKTTQAVIIDIAGMKLEIGDKATDWSRAPEDEDWGNTNATALAKTYTNTISQTDRAYTYQQRQALDESFNQAKVFNRLTNNGQAQGIVLKNGQLYINGTYIQTDTLNAGIIKTGILTDKAGKNRWNMATGYLYNKNAEFENSTVKGWLTSGTQNKAQFNNGTVRFFNGSTNALTIDGALKFSDGGYGAHITFPRYLVLRGQKLAVDDRVTGNGVNGATFTLRVMIPTAPNSWGKNTTGVGNSAWPSLANHGRWDWKNPSWVTLSLKFVNGILIAAGLG